MPRQLTRYVLLELIKVFLVALAVMTLLIVLIGVAQEAVRQNLGIGPILRLLPYILPNALRFAVPATILFSACVVYGRMSAHNEVTALKSLGISPMVVVWPVLAMGFVLSLTAVWINDVAVSWGRQGIQRVVVNSVEQIAYGMLRTQRSYSTPRFSINVKEVDGRRLIRPTIVIHSSGDSQAVTLTAAEAELKSNAEEGTLSVFLTNGTIETGRGIRAFFPEREEFPISLEDASRKGASKGKTSGLPLGKIPEQRTTQIENNRELEQTMAIRAAYQMASGEFNELIAGDWQHSRAQLRDGQLRLHRLNTEPWRRWANGFSCLFFVIVGAPLAIRLRNADITTSFIACFLPILVVYYPFLLYGIDRAKVGAVPPYTVWLGNVILLAGGVYLIRKMIRP